MVVPDRLRSQAKRGVPFRQDPYKAAGNRVLAHQPIGQCGDTEIRAVASRTLVMPSEPSPARSRCQRLVGSRASGTCKFGAAPYEIRTY